MISSNRLLESVFQPTLPIRGATMAWRIVALEELVSTHAPHTGSD